MLLENRVSSFSLDYVRCSFRFLAEDTGKNHPESEVSVDGRYNTGGVGIR